MILICNLGSHQTICESNFVRIFEFACASTSSLISQVQDADGAQDLQLAAGQVEFDRVSFSYVPGCVANMFLMIITVVNLWFPPV